MRGVGTSVWWLTRRRTIPGFSFVCNGGYYKLCAKIYLFPSSQSVLVLIFRCE